MTEEEDENEADEAICAPGKNRCSFSTPVIADTCVFVCCMEQIKAWAKKKKMLSLKYIIKQLIYYIFMYLFIG